MARSVTPAELMQRLESETDTQNDPHLTPAEKWRFLSAAVAEVWDRIVLYGGGTQYTKSVTFNSTANVAEHAIATIAPDGDFYRVSQMYTDEGSNQFRPVPFVHPAELHAYKPCPQSVPMKMYYTPCAPVWDGDGDTNFDGINGFEDLVIAIAAQKVMAKKNDSGAYFSKRQRELEARLADMAVRTDAEPARVVRRARLPRNTVYFPYRNNVTAWTIRGVNIELYYRDGVII